MNTCNLWEAVKACNPSFDGIFFYAVRTTGIFCCPSCKSRTPRQENILFFKTAEQALKAGFRPCKRCRPDIPAYDPSRALAMAAREIIDAHFSQPELLRQQLAALPVTRGHLIALFHSWFHTSPMAYCNKLRLEKAMSMLKKSASIQDVMESCGYESASTFYRAFRQACGMPPGAYKNIHVSRAGSSV